MTFVQALQTVVLKILSLILNPLKYIYTLNSFNCLFCSNCCVNYTQRIVITLHIGRICQIGTYRDLVLLDIFIKEFGIENVILKVADTTKLEGIVCLLEDKIINKEVDLCEPHEVQQGQVQGPTPGSG